jgi:hypothetical protein
MEQVLCLQQKLEKGRVGVGAQGAPIAGIAVIARDRKGKGLATD